MHLPNSQCECKSLVFVAAFFEGLGYLKDFQLVLLHLSILPSYDIATSQALDHP